MVSVTLGFITAAQAFPGITVLVQQKGYPAAPQRMLLSILNLPRPSSLTVSGKHGGSFTVFHGIDGVNGVRRAAVYCHCWELRIWLGREGNVPPPPDKQWTAFLVDVNLPPPPTATQFPGYISTIC